MLTYDKSHTLFTNIIKRQTISEDYIANAEYCLNILLTAPRYTIYDAQNLTDTINRMGLTEDERAACMTELPYNAFTVQQRNQILFYTKGDTINNDTDVAWTCIEWFYRGDDNEIFTSGPYQLHYDLSAQFSSHLDDELGKMCTDTGKAFVVVLNVCRKQTALITVPEKLQVKRAKNGKYPNFEYRIITLDAPAYAQVTKEQRFKIINRLSPRTHDRRGHYRHYKNDKRTYILPCIVNADRVGVGIIEKDYDVNK